MTVLDRTYRRWAGTPTPHWQRMLVLPRYALADLFTQRLTLLVFTGCFLPPLLLGGAIYVSANLDTILALVRARGLQRLQLTPSWFETFTAVQCWLTVMLTFLIGPRLVVQDLAGDALPLYFSKSLTRLEYAIGRWGFLVAILSVVSWMPLLAAFGLQLALATPEWRAANYWIGGSIVLTCVVLTLVLAALVTAVAAWLRRVVIAQAAFLGLFLVAHGFAKTLGLLAGSGVPDVLSPMAAILDIHAWAFTPPGQVSEAGLGPVAATIALLCWTGAGAALFLRRLRPVEAVR